MASDRTKKFAKVTQGKAFRIISNTLSTLILIVSIILCAVVVVSAKSSTGAPNFAGYSFLSVRSDSMEPAFYVGDLIVVKRYNALHRYEKGDIISFLATDLSGDRFINTHRVEEVIDNGGIRYVTKGDNSEEPDKKQVSPTKILGLYTGKRVAGLGRLLEFAGTSKGVLFTVVIPAAIIVIWQLLNYLLSLSERGLQPPVQQAAQSAASQPAPQIYPPAGPIDRDAVIREYLQQQKQEEQQRQQIIEEYLAEQKAREQAEKEKAEEAKIKAIIAEFLAQQQALGNDANKPGDPDDQNG